MTQMTIDIPNDLASLLEPYANRLPELLERGVRDVMQDRASSTAADETAILELLASNPQPEAVLALTPSPELQVRMSALLTANKAGTISRRDEAELERILLLERLVRMAKANAYKQLGQNT